MKILTAEEARKQSIENQKDPLEPVMACIDEASRSGRYCTAIDGILIPDSIATLRSLGYNVMIDNNNDIYRSTIISWDNA